MPVRLYKHYKMIDDQDENLKISDFGFVQGDEYVNMRLTLDIATGILQVIHGWNHAEFTQ